MRGATVAMPMALFLFAQTRRYRVATVMTCFSDW
jgi:hypothetical protein